MNAGDFMLPEGWRAEADVDMDNASDDPAAALGEEWERQQPEAEPDIGPGAGSNEWTESMMASWPDIEEIEDEGIDLTERACAEAAHVHAQHEEAEQARSAAIVKGRN